MMTKSNLKQTVLGILLAILLTGLLTGCVSQSPADAQLKQKELTGRRQWTVTTDADQETLTITHTGLAVVLKNARLNVKNQGELLTLSDWKVNNYKDRIVVQTAQPERTTWHFIINGKHLDIRSSASTGVITAVAPASAARIPARLADQDNGVIYTSLGLVSARNIYCLFDRMTDTMIQFPKQSSLGRAASDAELMNVTFPLRKLDLEFTNWTDNWGVTYNYGAQISLIPNYYTKNMGLMRYEPYYPQYENKRPFKTAPTGWLSWYCYYMPANEEDMVKETDALAESLKPYGLEYVQLDATYSGGEQANLLEWNKEKFPKGGKWLMHYIKKKGLKPGLWVNAYGANYANPSFGKYPEDWFLHDKDGKLRGACCTADATVVQLDFSNPQVLEKHLKPLFNTLVDDWGIKYLKDAGHGAWMFSYEKNRQHAYDPSVVGRDAYWQVQAVIREIMGPENWIMGCSAEGGASQFCLGVGTFDSKITIFEDVYADWERGPDVKTYPPPTSGTKMHLGHLFTSNYFNDIVVYNYPDATMIRPPLTTAEAITNVTSIALTGQSYMTSDFMADPSPERKKVLIEKTDWGAEFPDLVKKLPDERLQMYKKTIPAVDITPIDLFPYRSKTGYATLPEGYPSVENFPKALDLKVNAASGIYDIVALYNWSDESAVKTLSFEEDLGLCPNKQYLVYDFWNQRLVGIVKDQIGAEVAPHGTAVFIVKPLRSGPQLLATSRHITGAFSIKQLIWNQSKFTLSGVSETVPYTIYSLFIYVPDAVTLSEVDSNTRVLFHKLEDNLLEVAFQGQKTPVKWTLNFAREQ
ncbi:MAG: alpha-galactosidase [Planctomycetota bacterium]